MSQENVEAVRRAYKAWNTDDFDAFMADADPEIEVHPSIEPALEGGETTYRGFAAARKAWDNYHGGAWERSRAHIHEIRDLGESVLVLAHIDLTARTTGLEFTQELGQLITFRGGKVVRSQDFPRHAEALEAAGLSE
jgi:ketosteroid isomerase-like protein